MYFVKPMGAYCIQCRYRGGPDGVPLAATKAGPLKPRANGVECFGTRAVFDGDLLVSPKP